MWSQVKSERFAKANPNLKINTNVVATADPPLVSFEFIDGSKVSATRKSIKKYALAGAIESIVISIIFIAPLRSLSLFEQKEFASEEFVVNEMLDDVYITANNMDIEYELEGKSID